MPTGGIVYAYVRESNADQLDPAGQERDCRALALRYGYDPDALTIVSDWGMSGRRNDRPGWLVMKRAIAEGKVAAVLARSVDRLGRDAQEVMDFEALAIRHGTRVLTDRDGERTVDPDAVNTVVRYLPALLAQEESRLGRDRARRGRATRQRNIAAHRETCRKGASCRDTQHWDGRPPASPARVKRTIEAFIAAGSYNGAAALLNDSGNGRSESTTVARIIRWAQANGLLPTDVRLPKSRHAGRRTLSRHVMSGLVRCPHDGSTLTVTNRIVRAGLDVSLFCRKGRTNFDHPRPYSVPERIVRDVVREATADVLQRPETGQAVTIGPDGSVSVGEPPDPQAALRHAELVESRDALLAAVTAIERAGLPTDALRAQVAGIEDALQALAQESALVVMRTPIDWDAPPAEVNVRLHALIHHVELDEYMRPTAIVWRQAPAAPVSDGVHDLDADLEETSLDPRAVRTADGWLLPLGGD